MGHSALPVGIYVVALIAGTTFVGTHPRYGWDMLGYVGVIESWHTSDSRLIQYTAYSAIRQVPEYSELTGAAACQPEAYGAYRADLAHNSEHFSQQLIFYSVKPLYVLIVSAIHRLGLSYAKSFAVVSAVSYFALGWITWLWLSRYWPKWPTLGFCVLVMIDPEIMAVGRATSPDALALAALGSSLFLLLEYPASIWGPCLLLISLWIRPDALILVGALLITLLLLQVDSELQFGNGGAADFINLFWIQLKRNRGWLLLAATASLSFIIIQWAGRPYSWRVLFYHSFIGYLVAPADSIVRVTPQMFVRILAVNFRTLLGNSAIAMVLLMGFLVTLLHPRQNYRFVTVAVIASVLLHFFFYPSDAARFHVPATFFVPVSLLVACAAFALNKDAVSVESAAN